MTDQHGANPPPEDPAGGAGGAEQPEVVEAEIVEGDLVDGEGDVVDGETLEGEVVDGEFVEPAGAEQAEADALLAEALDAAAIEAEFSSAEADLAAVDSATDPQVAALITDLQRVHAEYSNYRKRVERDRDLIRQRAVESTLAELLPILDDIGRARDHDELVGGFRSVGESLEATVTRLGLTAFGAVGEPFDPTRHEALMREERAGVTEPTVVTVLQVGYEMNGRIVRPARVSVAGTD